MVETLHCNVSTKRQDNKIWLKDKLPNQRGY